jgi:hypothetical protein
VLLARVRPAAVQSPRWRLARVQVRGFAGCNISDVNTQIKALELQIAGQLATCADGHSFTSLPSTEQIFGAAVDNNTYLMCRDSYSALCAL